jgi:hypothetical protein
MFICKFHRPHDGTVLEVPPHVTGVIEAMYEIVGDCLEGSVGWVAQSV